VWTQGLEWDLDGLSSSTLTFGLFISTSNRIRTLVTSYIYMDISVYMYVCIYIYVCMYIYMCVYVYLYIYMYMYIYVYIDVYTHTHSYTHIYTYICMLFEEVLSSSNSIRPLVSFVSWKNCGILCRILRKNKKFFALNIRLV
jgi:hypothetical protein